MKRITFLISLTLAALSFGSCITVDDLRPDGPYEQPEEKPENSDENRDEQPEPVKEPKVVFNELCGNKIPDGPQKFIELFNAGEAEGFLEGWTIRKYAADATDILGKYNICWMAPAGQTLAAGEYLVLEADQGDSAKGFNAGLSAKKGVKFELVDADGNVVDKFVRGEDEDPFMEPALPENKEASFSRVPNGEGEWAYAVPTPGAANGAKTGDIENE